MGRASPADLAYPVSMNMIIAQLNSWSMLTESLRVAEELEVNLYYSVRNTMEYTHTKCNESGME